MTKILFLFLITGLAALILHGQTPYHYFYILLPLVTVLFGVFLAKLGRRLLIVAMVMITGLSFWFYEWAIDLDDGFTPFEKQVAISKSIVEKAAGRSFRLNRVGPGDEFEGDFAQNYQYLMWLLGNEPKESAGLQYTIYERNGSVSFSSD